MLAEEREAEATVADRALGACGRLRVSASASFCLQHIEPMRLPFTRRYPEIRLDIVEAQRGDEPIDNGVDVAVRTREIEESKSRYPPRWKWTPAFRPSPTSYAAQTCR